MNQQAEFVAKILQNVPIVSDCLPLSGAGGNSNTKFVVTCNINEIPFSCVWNTFGTRTYELRPDGHMHYYVCCGKTR